MSIIQTADINIPTDPITLKKIKDACIEFEGDAKKIQAAREHQKDIIDVLAEETEIPKKYLKKLATLYYKGNRDKVFAETNATDTFYDKVFGIPPERAENPQV